MSPVLAYFAISALGLSWWIGCDWMRHRPENLKRGTQHLVLLGVPGFLFFVFGLVGAIATTVFRIG